MELTKSYILFARSEIEAVILGAKKVKVTLPCLGNKRNTGGIKIVGFGDKILLI